jgi:hypothetical protein
MSMHAVVTAGNLDLGAARALENLIRFLETGKAPEDLFAPDAFADLSLPLWRLQASGPVAVSALRTDSHPDPGRLLVSRADATARGFVMEFEERWESGGQSWYCREMLRADVRDGQITEMSVYCTGDWDERRQAEHAQAVRLVRS